MEPSLVDKKARAYELVCTMQFLQKQLGDTFNLEQQQLAKRVNETQQELAALEYEIRIESAREVKPEAG